MICNRENSGIARDGADAGGKALAILYYFYPEDTPLRRMLVRHCEQVREKALAILADSGVELDARLAADGAMLHDIGIGALRCPEDSVRRLRALHRPRRDRGADAARIRGGERVGP